MPGAMGFPNGHPFQSFDSAPLARVYILYETGYHLFSGFSMLFDLQRMDLWEMVLHHVVTIELITISYITNHYRANTLVLLIHGMSDISLYILRWSAEIGNIKILKITYYSCMVVYAYLRLYVYPKDCIYYILTGLPYCPGCQGYEQYAALTCCLMGLNVYFYINMILIGVGYYRKESYGDPSYKDGKKI